MARIIWGCTVEPELEGVVKIMVVITGVKSSQFLGREIVDRDDIEKVR